MSASTSATPGRRLSLWVLGLVAAVAFGLGLVGYYEDDAHFDRAEAAKVQRPLPAPRRVTPRYALDLGYRAVQLFMLGVNPRSSPVPVPLEAARWLAGIVAGVALLKAAAELFKQQLADRRLRRLADHVIVCGLGRKGLHLVEQLHARGEHVVVIEIDEGDDGLGTCRAMGVPVLIGDATSELILEQAGAARAARLIAVCSDDGVNIEIALEARQVVLAARRALDRPLICHVHLIDPRLAQLYRQHDVLTGAGDAFEARIFSFYENSARDLWLNHPLDAPATGARPPTVHLVVVGLGHMGEAVALQAARIGHFSGGEPLRLTVIDPAANERQMNLAARYPQLDQVVELSFEARSLEHPDVRDALIAWASDPDQRLLVAVCIDDDSAALSLALNLPRELKDENLPVFVRQSEQRGLAALIADRAPSEETWNVVAFGAPEVSAGLEQILQEQLDRLARAIHERYVSHRQADGALPLSDPALEPWPQLDAMTKSSNRQQADHIDVKLRAIGCRRLASNEAPPPGTQLLAGFSPEELDQLARMEHARWCADRLLDDWRLGPADKPRKITPFLVPFDDLPLENQEYDRQAVLLIPDLVALAGGRIVRVIGQTMTPSHDRSTSAEG